MDDLRVETRLNHEVTILIEVQTSTATSANVVLCNSLDLSANGLQVVLDHEIAQGGIFRLFIDIRDQDPIFLVAEAKWVRPDPDETASFRIGLLIFESEDTNVAQWKEYIAGLLDAPSGTR